MQIDTVSRVNRHTRLTVRIPQIARPARLRAPSTVPTGARALETLPSLTPSR
jgi:hypothetical protein